jgi:voltage-gated potassium channel Kch
MLLKLLLASCLIAATVAVQATFMSAGLEAFRKLEEKLPSLLLHRAAITVAWVIFLTIPIAIDVCLWGAFYYFSEALPNLEDSLYFSTVTFTTVGYGDIVLGKEWRQLSTFEAVNGWIIFGWATALMMAVIQRLYFRPSP